jgi:hypothetical protein
VLVRIREEIKVRGGDGGILKTLLVVLLIKKCESLLGS